MTWLALWAVLLAGTQASAQQGYDNLVALFREWREFQQPRLVDGVADYTAAAMAAQQRQLPAYQHRLAAIDTAGWTVPQRVDWALVRAEMNGLDFDHRVLRPWARDPTFYVTVFPSQSDQPAREGHYARGGIELWRDGNEEIAAGLRAIPRLLEQARTDLVGDAGDLWTMGIRRMRAQSGDLEALAQRVAGNASLAADVQRAREATDQFRAWLESQAASRTGPSGIGVENYDWYLEHVQLAPYRWQDIERLMRRELARSVAALKLEEERNRALPAHQPITSQAEWERRFNAAVGEYVAFLRDRQVLTVKGYMEPALRARLGRFAPGPREFFNEVNYRDPIVMRTHDFHWIDLARMTADPHPSPIRRGPLLYNIFITRTEGLATALEEMIMHTGFLDTHPRGRELIYILVAQRAARALGDLMMHANRWTLEQAAQFTASQTPRQWLRLDGNTVWGEQHLYLRQPAYGTSYLMGKMEIERLLADRARAQGAAFTLQRFMDQLTAVGMVPMSVVRWELFDGEPPAR